MPAKRRVTAERVGGTSVAEYGVRASRSILVADDNSDVRDSFALALRDEGFHVRAARDAYEARRLFADWRADLVLSDIRMPGDGMMLLQAVHTMSPRTPVILMTAFEQPGDRLRAMTGGAVDFLVKPIPGDLLRSAVTHAFERTSQAPEQRQHQKDQQQRAQHAARPVAPAAAVRPRGQRADDENE